VESRRGSATVTHNRSRTRNYGARRYAECRRIIRDLLTQTSGRPGGPGRVLERLRRNPRRDVLALPRHGCGQLVSGGRARTKAPVPVRDE